MQNITTPQKDPILSASRRFFQVAALALAALAAAVCLAWGVPQSAWGLSSQVEIQAEINDQGDLIVHEKRTIEPTHQNDVLIWSFDNLDEGTTLRVTDMTVTQEGVTRPLLEEPFNLEWRTGSMPDNPAFSYDDPQHKLYVFCDVSQTATTIDIDYVIEDMAVLYADYGELFWQFISPAGEESSQNVSLELTLPVKEDASVVAGETVYAWSHGPSDLNVEIDQNGVVRCSTEEVQEKQFAQVRVLFPADWLSGIQADDDNADTLTQRFDSVLNEEQVWSDWGNTNFVRLLVVLVVLSLLSVLALVWFLVSLVRFRRETKAHGQTFVQDDAKPLAQASIHEAHGQTSAQNAQQACEALLASGIPAAVIGRIDRFNHRDEKDFYATVLDLVAQGALVVTPCDSQDRAGSSQATADHDYLGQVTADCGELGQATAGKDYRLTAVGEVANALPVGIERSALMVLFKTIAPAMASTQTGVPVQGSASFDGQSIKVSTIEAFKRQHPTAYRQALDAWNKELDRSVQDCKCFETYFQAKKTPLTLIMLLLVVVSVIGFLIGNHPALLIPGVASVIIMALASLRLKRRTNSGAERYSQCAALRFSAAQGSCSKKSAWYSYAFVLGAFDVQSTPKSAEVDLVSRLLLLVL